MGKIINPYVFGTSGVSDPNFANVPVLFHFDGVVGSSPPRPHNFGYDTTLWQFGSGASIATSHPLYGVGDMLCDGVNTQCSPDSTSANFVLGSGDLTVEWAMYTGSPNQLAVLVDWAGVTPEIYINNGDIHYYNGAERIVTSAVIATNTWQQCCWCRVGGVSRLFVDGVQVGSNFTDSINCTASQFSIGISNANLFPFNGEIDEFRLTTGVGRYAANYTPATGPFPNS